MGQRGRARATMYTTRACEGLHVESCLSLQLVLLTLLLTHHTGDCGMGGSMHSSGTGKKAGVVANGCTWLRIDGWVQWAAQRMRCHSGEDVDERRDGGKRMGAEVRQRGTMRARDDDL